MVIMSCNSHEAYLDPLLAACCWGDSEKQFMRMRGDDGMSVEVELSVSLFPSWSLPELLVLFTT